MPLRERERRDRIRRYARQLANKGRYATWRDIETTLLAEGHVDATLTLASLLVRIELSARCALAKPSPERSAHHAER